MSALAGIRVLDLSSVLMGPLAARVLGDMGADVIKVESPEGDALRNVGPMRSPGMGPLYYNANRNKRSVALDLKSQPGKEALRKLVAGADVLLYNIRPRSLERLGFGYEACYAINPRIIHVGAYGFGQDGPYAARPAFDDLIQGLSGIPSLIASASKSGNPQYIPLAMADRFVGLAVANAILGALVHQVRTGEGQAIEVPMFETMAETVLGDHSGGHLFDPPIGPPGYPRSRAPERRPYKTRDGFICVMLYSDRHWRDFFAIVGSDLPRTDPRFANLTQRTLNASAIHTILEEHLAQRSTGDWLRVLEEADIPASRLHTLETLADDEHLKQVGFFRYVDDPNEGRVRMLRNPANWSRTPPVYERFPPRIGEHTREVLREASFDDEEIDRMIESRAAR